MTRVYVDMVGDLFHYGYIRFLRKAKKYGNILIVGVHSDIIVKNYKRIPIMKMNERIEVIESCKYVDKVIPDAPLVIIADYLKKHKIDIVCHAHSKEEHEEYSYMYKIPSKLGIFKRLDYTTTISTTGIIHNILDNKKDKTKIFIPMSCDILHYGHILYFEKIKKKYNESIFIIGLILDNCIKEFKGGNPVMNYNERKKVLEGCKYVNKIIPYNNYNTKIDKEFLKKNKI